MSANKDGIQFIRSYLVRPSDKDSSSGPIGTDIPLSGHLFKTLQIIFDKSDNECKIEIVFQKAQDGSQSNPVRDLLVQAIEATTKPVRHSAVLGLANKLLEHTNRVTGPGLLFVIGGFSKGHSKIMISRFPADEGIMADEQNGRLTVQFVDKLFMKDRNSYKAVVFHRLSSTSTRRNGKAVDKQVNDIRNPSSRYWIEDFLNCTLSVTSEAGSERFASALREVYNAISDLDKKAEIASAANLLKNFQAQKKTPREFLEALNLDNDIISEVEQRLGKHAMTETFELNTSYFKSSFRFQSKLLHTGVMITAEVDQYNDVVHETEVDGEVKFTTQGKVVNSKVQKTRANGAM